MHILKRRDTMDKAIGISEKQSDEFERTFEQLSQTIMADNAMISSTNQQIESHDTEILLILKNAAIASRATKEKMLAKLEAKRELKKKAMG